MRVGLLYCAAPRVLDFVSSRDDFVCRETEARGGGERGWGGGAGRGAVSWIWLWLGGNLRRWGALYGCQWGACKRTQRGCAFMWLMLGQECGVVCGLGAVSGESVILLIVVGWR